MKYHFNATEQGEVWILAQENSIHLKNNIWTYF